MSHLPAGMTGTNVGLKISVAGFSCGLETAAVVLVVSMSAGASFTYEAGSWLGLASKWLCNGVMSSQLRSCRVSGSHATSTSNRSNTQQKLGTAAACDPSPVYIAACRSIYSSTPTPGAIPVQQQCISRTHTSPLKVPSPPTRRIGRKAAEMDGQVSLASLLPFAAIH